MEWEINETERPNATLASLKSRLTVNFAASLEVIETSRAHTIIPDSELRDEDRAITERAVFWLIVADSQEVAAPKRSLEFPGDVKTKVYAQGRT